MEVLACLGKAQTEPQALEILRHMAEVAEAALAVQTVDVDQTAKVVMAVPTAAVVVLAITVLVEEVKVALAQSASSGRATPVLSHRQIRGICKCQTFLESGQQHSSFRLVVRTSGPSRLAHRQT